MATAAPPAERPTAHTSTQQWQSFEMRMRQRRIDRLLLRAQIAHEAGRDEEAREALAEAELLNGHAGTLAELLPPPPLEPIPASDVAEPVAADAPIDEAPAQVDIDSDSPSRAWMPRVAAVLTVAGALGWFTGSQAPYRPTVAAISQSRPTATMLGASAQPPAAEAEAPAVRLSVADVAARPAVTEVASESEGARPEPQPTSLVKSEVPQPGATTGTAATSPPRFALGVPPVAALEAAPPSANPPAVPVASSTDLAATGTTSAAPVALPPPVPPTLEETPEPAAPPARSVPADDTGVRTALARYESAYSRLDADAAGAVWPGLDRKALARAFDGLASQRVSLGSCDVRILVAGESAVAECAGSATWTPKIGGGSRNQQRRWQFRLRNGISGWQIVGANVR